VLKAHSVQFHVHAVWAACVAPVYCYSSKSKLDHCHTIQSVTWNSESSIARIPSLALLQKSVTELWGQLKRCRYIFFARNEWPPIFGMTLNFAERIACDKLTVAVSDPHRRQQPSVTNPTRHLPKMAQKRHSEASVRRADIRFDIAFERYRPQEGTPTFPPLTKRDETTHKRPNDPPTDRRAAPVLPVPPCWPKVGIPFLGPTNY
jgi:hypothetical protein